MPTTPPADRSQIAAEMGMLGVVLIWGANFSITKVSIGQIPPLAFTALRFLIATAALFILVRLFEPGTRTPKSSIKKLAVVGFIGNTVYQPCFILGLANTSATNSAVIIGALPGVVAFLAWALGIERVTRQAAIGIGIAMLGVLLVVGGGFELERKNILGDLLTVGAVFCWAGYTLGLRRSSEGISPLKVTAITTATGTPGLILIGLPQLLQMNWNGVPASAFGGLAYAALVSLPFAYFLYNRGVSVLGPSKASAFSSLIPIAGMALAWTIVHDTPKPSQIAGAALVVAGVWLTRARRPLPPEG
jgi:drug/metabolite transporter (DMT)-like permease